MFSKVPLVSKHKWEATTTINIAHYFKLLFRFICFAALPSSTPMH
jgi:hypothetical protein